MPPRAILHVDMDAFFAAVEQLDDPSLRGKPVLVGYDGPRGVVAAASYEARKFGCHSAQPMAVAKRNCPHAVVVAGHFERYREVSDQVFEILEAFSPLIEPLSIDEAFLEVSGTGRALGTPEAVARELKTRVKERTGLTASVGVSHNKFLAKLASDLGKPDGLKVIRPEEVEVVLPALPVGRIWGIGPKTETKLAGLAIRTIGDLRKMSLDWFEGKFGSDGERLRRLCFGQDDRPVTPDREAKSIGQEQTFQTDVNEPDEIRRELLGQVQHVARRLRKHGLAARSVGLKIRFGDFQTITRALTLDEPTDVTAMLWRAALQLFDQWAARSFSPVRLIGVHAAGLAARDAGQMPLFPDPEALRQRRLDRAVDRINDRFGRSIIRRGGE